MIFQYYFTKKMERNSTSDGCVVCLAFCYFMIRLLFFIFVKYH